ncbi:PDZ domain-containing protein [Candidatus Uabimicrobium sp. HlEnr_7]|uniref:PDZ domain-containing protein n=1 Tax=Candidatus Uabimicrobium helgolandensis TaxID=3095367 RepID=UPI003558FD60
MNRTKHYLCLILAMMLSLQAQESTAKPDQTNNQVEIRKVMKKVYPALVRISVVTAFVSQGREQKSFTSGSGAIISSDGYVVTNHHVVGGAKRIWCTLSNKEEVEADLIGTDALCDIAVIKLKPWTMRIPVRSFAYASWGDSKDLKIGQKVFAMGSPGAISQTVTYGIIGNLNMVIPKAIGGRNSFMLDGEPVGSIVRWIIHDATIFGGNSGGPLVDLDGSIIGINEIGIAGLGGAIPANTAKRVANSIIKKGYVERSWTGVRVQTLLKSDKRIYGVLASDIIKGSPADEAGIKSGDIITEFGGERISGRYEEQIPVFNSLVFDTAVGNEVSVTILRKDKELKLKLTTRPRGKAKETDQEILYWGITARNLTKLNTVRLRRESKKGVYISSVRPGGPCGQAKPSIRIGDIITKIGGMEVNDLNSLLDLTTKLSVEKKTIVVEFERRKDLYLTAVQLGEDDKDNWARARKAWFPAKVQVLTTPLAKALNLEGKKGVRITRLYPQLHDSDFRLGDILTHLNGTSIDASNTSHSQVFPTMIRRFRARKKVDFSIIRNGKEMVINYKLPKSPKPSEEMKTYTNEHFEFTVRNLAVMDKISLDLPQDYKGAILKEVRMGGWMSLARIATNDILLNINNNKIENVKDVAKIMENLHKEKPNSVVFYIYRRGRYFYAEARPKW